MQRWQALLQWGKPAENDSATEGKQLSCTRRSDASTDVYFLDNSSGRLDTVMCSFGGNGRQPELWQPVTGTRRDLPQFRMRDGRTIVPLQFADRQSVLVIFRKPTITAEKAGSENFPILQPIREVAGPWTVQFDPTWGGPAAVRFNTLTDWPRGASPRLPARN